LIASRKGTAFADELALYLSEFGVELDQLQAALLQDDAANAGHYAHLLYGRCAFIAERELEQLLRRIEEVSANGQWDEAPRPGRGPWPPGSTGCASGWLVLPQLFRPGQPVDDRKVDQLRRRVDVELAHDVAPARLHRGRR
jgi:HPt (histidine-containing phosphotransfer) domain-containing protein